MENVSPFMFFWITVFIGQTSSQTTAIPDDDFYYHPHVNPNRSTPSGIDAVRSSLTLDWLAAEDSRQRELVSAFENDQGSPVKIQSQDCIAYPRPAPGKVARLMLELLKNLEGDEGSLITDLIHALIRSKLLVLETSVFDAEPDLEALVKTPGAMMGEPHVTFPRILGMVWLTVTDPGTVKRHGWCHIIKVTKYLTAARPSDIAKNMHALEPIIARARFLMEEFIQHITPLNMGQMSSKKPGVDPGHKPKHISHSPVAITTSRGTFMNRPFIRRMQENSTTIESGTPPSIRASATTPSRKFLDYEPVEGFSSASKLSTKNHLVTFCFVTILILF